jgi:hypothetical protein
MCKLYLSRSGVRLGEHDASKTTDCILTNTFGEICTTPADYKVEKIITHPLHNTVTKHNDIALIRVSEDISFDSCKKFSKCTWCQVLIIANKRDSHQTYLQSIGRFRPSSVSSIL